MIRKMMWLPVLAAALMTGAAAAQPDGFLRTSGERIVDGRGQEVLLRGMGLGGWMLQEGYMLGIKKEGTQHSIKARIAELIGKEDTERFYRLWRQNHMTRDDADRLAASGFNSIRLPMHYNLFTLPIEEEPVKGSDTWLATGFELTDNLLEWCRANRMYLILDLHAAPGGQGKDANISDYDPRKPSLWESGENRRKTVALWRKLAERYANEPWIGGYDILNEPNWTFEGKDKNGKEDVSNAPIWELYKEITKAIREVDTKHIIIVEGNGWGNNYNGFPGPWDRNLVMSFHKYWNPNTEEAIAPFLALREKYRLPVWLGESGENTNEWFRECVALVEKHGIGWAWWPHKKVGSPRCIMTVTAPDDFKKVVGYWNGEVERPSRESAARGLFGLVENLKADKCGFNADVAQALIPERAVLIAPADKPAARYDVNSLLAHAQLLEKARAGGIDVYFVGDSITRRWGATDYPELLANWTKNFFGWNAANFGWGADRTENILWRLEHGELDGVNPKVIVVLAGTNNVGAKPGDETKVAEITRGLRAILDACRRKAPAATIVLTAIFPRNDDLTVMPEISRVNENIARFADNKLVRYLDVNPKLADKDGRLFPGMMHDGLHPTVQGYQVWADGLKPILTEVLGPPAATDHAPSPTGDPSAKR